MTAAPTCRKDHLQEHPPAAKDERPTAPPALVSTASCLVTGICKCRHQRDRVNFGFDRPVSGNDHVACGQEGCAKSSGMAGKSGCTFGVGLGSSGTDGGVLFAQRGFLFIKRRRESGQPCHITLSGHAIGRKGAAGIPLVVNNPLWPAQAGGRHNIRARARTAATPGRCLMAPGICEPGAYSSCDALDLGGQPQLCKFFETCSKTVDRVQVQHHRARSYQHRSFLPLQACP